MLADRMARSGEWLFRWRSYVPLAFVPIALAAFADFHYPYGSHWLAEVRMFCCLAVAFVGLALRVAIVGYVPRNTSGRNTKRLQAPSLNTTGLYSTVRHPLYLANFIIFFAALAASGSFCLLLSGSLAYWLYYERIILAEEKFLLGLHGEAFVAWADRTPPILPNVSNFQPPELPFSWRSAVKREYQTLALIVVIFTCIEVAGDSLVEGRIEFEPHWQLLCAVAASFYLTVRVIRRATPWLSTADR